MKDGFLKVGAVSFDLKIGDVSHNVSEIKRKIDRAIADGVELVVFPELCLCGYTCGDLVLLSTLLDACKKGLIELATFTKGKKVLAFVGLPFEKDGKIYNCGAAISGGEIVGIFPKTSVPNYGEFYELRYFAPAPEQTEWVTIEKKQVPFGKKLLVCDEKAKNVVVACEICEDLWVSDSPSIEHTKAGATVVVNLSASNELVGKVEYRRMLVQTQSRKNDCAYVYANPNTSESTSETVYSGHNIVCENGEILAESEPFTSGYAVAEVDVDYLTFERQKTTTYNSQTSEYTRVYADFVGDQTPTRLFSQTPFVPENECERNELSKLVLTVQSQALARRLQHVGAKTAVLGISGGLDSTLALLVTVRAFDMLRWDRKGIICVTMPGFGTTGKTYQNALSLVKGVGATLKEISIVESVKQHFKDIGHAEDEYDATYENAQARMRTLILMDLANQTNGIVVGTGDMSELALGWCTYNGDQMSMYGVNSSIAKTLVRHLVESEAKRFGGTLQETLFAVCNTEISPELLPSDGEKITQKTEDLVGPYILHDYFLYHFIARGASPKKIYACACRSFDGLFDGSTILKWLKNFYRRFFTQQFKRSSLPDGVKVSPVCLSARGDWRMSSDAYYTLWIQELEEIDV